MNLLIIGHTAHFEVDGTLVGWGPTIREIDWIAKVFDKVTHLATLRKGEAPLSASGYEGRNIEIHTVAPSGGLSSQAKMKVIGSGKEYLQAIKTLIADADVVHVRCPGSLGMYGMLAVSVSNKYPKWIKYAGNWQAPTALSHRFQRQWLYYGLNRSPVTVNGRWTKQPKHVHSFLNPSFSLQEIKNFDLVAREKPLESPVRFIFVGRTTQSKGLSIAIDIVAEVRKRTRKKIIFEVVGDDSERSIFEDYSAQSGLKDVTLFHGWLPQLKVFERLLESHFVLLPSSSEGWPKVLSEGMMCGAVPVASDISSIPQILSNIGIGITRKPLSVEEFVPPILDLIKHPSKWKRQSAKGIDSAPLYSYERYLLSLDEMLTKAYGQSPMNQQIISDIRNQFN